jgi:Flp pilus assembly protein TadG
MGRLLRARAPRRGQAMVEFALVLPILVLIIFGLVDLGRAVYVNNSLAEAARDGARYGSVQARSYDAARRADVAAWIEDRLEAVPNATVTVECTPASPALGCTVNDILVVTVSSDLDMITPLIGGIVGPLGLESRSEVIVNN